MELYWTSIKTINGLRHFVVINQYQLKKEAYLDFVSVLDEAICFTIPKKVLEESNQWVKGWNHSGNENIDIDEYLEFKSTLGEIKTNKVFLNENSLFNIS